MNLRGARRPGWRASIVAIVALTTVVTIGPAEPARALGEITEYQVGAATDRLEGITLGGDGNLWVAASGASRIDRVTPAGAVTSFKLAAGRDPARITAGPDGALWFSENAANRIGRITTDGVVTEFVVPTKRAQPNGITVGPDGALWFTEMAASKIGRITTGGAITEYPLPTGLGPDEITNGPDGNLWFTLNSGNRIGRISTDGTIHELLPIPTAAGGLNGITTGSDAAVWFTERTADKIGRVTTAGEVTEFPVAVPGAKKVSPAHIVSGPDGALWITAISAGAIIRMTTDGAYESFAVPTPNSSPHSITTGPDNDVWFTEKTAGKVGRIAVGPTGPGVANLALSVRPAAVAAGHEKTPATNLAASTLDNTALLQGAPLASSPLASSPLASSPLASSPLASSPLASSPLASSPLASSELAPVLLSAIPLASSSWTEVLLGSKYEGLPLQTITLGDVFALPDAERRLAELTLANVPLASSPLASSSLAALLLGNLPLAALPAPAGGWCAFLVPQPANCTNGVDVDTTTLLGLELAGDDLSEYFSQQIELTEVTLGDAPLAFVRLVTLNLAQTPLGAVPPAQVPSLMTCAPAACAATLAAAQAADQLSTTATVADALALLPVPALSHLGLGELLAGMIAPWDLPYEVGPQSDILDHALIRDFDLLSFTASFDLHCAQAEGLEVIFHLTDGFRVRPGTSELWVGDGQPAILPEPSVDGGTVRYEIATGGFNQPCSFEPIPDVHGIALRVQVEPTAVLGGYPSSVSVSTAADRDAGTVLTASAGLQAADDSHDQDADPAAAQPIDTDAVYSSHIAHGGDIDTFAAPAPPADTTLRVSLAHLPADYDLVVYGPSPGLPVSSERSSPLASSPLGSSPLGSSPLPDNNGEPGANDSNLAPNSLADVPIGSAPLASSGLVVRGQSIRRDSSTEAVSIPITEADQGGAFIIQVSGFNGASSPRPYSLHTAVEPGTPPLACAARSFVGGGTPAAFPALPLPAATKALFLVDAKRMGDLYGASAAAGMLTTLQAVAARPDVAGVVVPVESDPTADVGGAFAAWDADACSVVKANAVVSEINAVVDHVRSASAGLPNLRSIVLVGPDDAMPQARVPDLVHLSNEREYGIEAAVGGADTGVSRALADGFVLTDDPYGDFDPRPWLSGSLYIPDVALGRLVETPADIGGTLQQFIDFNGALNPQSAFVTGYDFMTDGANAILDAIRPAVPAGKATSRIDETWTAADALEGLNTATPGFAAVNAHYNHFQALPAQSFTAGDTADLLTAAQANPAAGSLLFTMGCHAGLNIPDIGVAVPNPAQAESLHDWAQTAGDHGAVLAANTGFGYGDTEVVAYSERLLQYYAENLAAHTMTASQALTVAKQRYFADLGVAGVYDAKILQTSTFYGLPMWRIGPGGGEALPMLPPPVAEEPPTVTLRSSSFSTSPTTERVDTDRGSYWTVPGEHPQVTHFNSIQPRMAIDVTNADGLPVHGALVESLASTDITGVDTVWDRPTVDLSSNEPEPSGTEAFFPAQVQATHSAAGATGRVDQLVLMPGQFRLTGGVATQRLFSQIGGTVYRSDSNDWSAPTIDLVTAQVVNGGVTFTVITPSADTVRGVVLWRDDVSPIWRTSELLLDRAGTWSAGALLAPGGTRVLEFTVQLVDGAGNVGASTNKGRNHVGLPATAPPGGLAIRQTPEPGPSGYATAPVTVTVEGIPDGHTATVTIDGGQPFIYEGPFTISEDGVHEVRAVTDDGSATGVTFVAIDTTKPVITGSASPAPNAAGWNNTPVTVHFTCNDATSGIASCSPDTTLSADGANQSVEGTAVDRVGLSATTKVGVNIDRTPATTSITRPPFLVLLTPLTGSAVDATSGVQQVTVVFDPILIGTRTVRTFTCNTGGGVTCAWSVPRPPSGIYKVTATSTDMAGNPGIPSTIHSLTVG